MLKFLWLALLLLVLTSIFQSFCSSQSLVFVDSECDVANESCYDLDDALDHLTSNTTLGLESGTHIICRSHVQGLRNMSDVSIVGDGREETVVSCEGEFALSFINVTDLMISNLTITGCGLTGNSLQDATVLLSRIVNLNFYIPEVGIFLGHCQNFRMTNALITNTSGIGFLGVNIFGKSELRDVKFTRNIHPGCLNDTPILGQTSSGGAFFLYEDLRSGLNEMNDVTLSISNSDFSYNADCNTAGQLNVVYQYRITPIEFSYYAGGGGGLSLVTTQQNYTVNVEVKSSNFYKNDAFYGGGVYIALFAGLGVNNIQFMDCTFDSNGLSSGMDTVNKPRSKGGAGIAVFMDILLFSGHSRIGHPPSISCINCKVIVFDKMNFTSNAALNEGGAVMVYSLSKSIRIDYRGDNISSDLSVNFSTCHFENNFAMYGSALYVFQRADISLDGDLVVVLNDIFITGSQAEYNSEEMISNQDQVSAVDLRNVIAIGAGYVIIKDNFVSGIHLSSSFILTHPHTVLTIEGNRANRGAGIYLDGLLPVIWLGKSSRLQFLRNQANLEGGAVYYKRSIQGRSFDPLSVLGLPYCFVSNDELVQTNFFKWNLTIEFIDNVAASGSMIYGTSLWTCPWASQVNVTHEHMMYMELYDNSEYYNSTFVFIETPNGTKQVSSDPFMIKVNEQNRSITSYPGQVQYIRVSTLDLFMNKIDALITTNSIGGDDVDIRTGSSGFWYNRNKPLPLYVNGNASRENRTVSLLTVDGRKNTNITVRILDCPLGFIYDDETHSCKCNITDIYGLDCNERPLKLIVHGRRWLGCASSNCLVFEDLVLINCYFSYCDPDNDVVQFDQPSSDKQCVIGSHRTGVMCGSCAEGYSSVFGSGKCEICSGTNVAIVFIILIISSVYFLCIALLGLTVDKGWTNMVVLLAGIVFPYAFVEASPFKVILSAVLPLKAFTLDFSHVGFHMCFYDGMTPIVKSVLHFINPLYLSILMLAFAIICHFSTRLSTFLSPSKTLVSLAIILYATTFGSSLEILVGLSMKTIGGKDLHPRWLIDPNVQYFDGLHGVFVIVSILLFIGYIIPLPLALLSPTLAYKYVPRSKPLLDVIWAPFKPKYRFWISVRLLINVYIAMQTKFNTPDLSIPLNVSVLLIFAHIQCTLQPFNSKLINIADSFLILATGFLHASLLSRALSLETGKQLTPVEIAFIAIVLPSIYFVLLLTLILCSKDKAKKLFNKFHTFLKAKKVSRELLPPSSFIESRPTHNSVSIVNLKYKEINNMKCRESLLEDDESGIL